MAISIEQHIEELRAELRNAVDPDERRWIEEELARALEEREAIWAELLQYLTTRNGFSGSGAAPGRARRQAVW